MIRCKVCDGPSTTDNRIMFSGWTPIHEACIANAAGYITRGWSIAKAIDYEAAWAEAHRAFEVQTANARH